MVRFFVELVSTGLRLVLGFVKLVCTGTCSSLVCSGSGSPGLDGCLREQDAKSGQNTIGTS